MWWKFVQLLDEFIGQKINYDEFMSNVGEIFWAILFLGLIVGAVVGALFSQLFLQ